MRFYDKEGLLKPAYTDSKSGYRYYLSSQLVTVQKILSLCQIGIPIEQIKIMINTNDEQYQLEKYQQELRNSIMETQKKINIIQIMLDGEYPYDVFIKNWMNVLYIPVLPELTVIFSFMILFNRLKKRFLPVLYEMYIERRKR